MKKNLIYALALATTMVACTDDYTDWAAPQTNGPEEAKSVSLSVSPASAIDFATEVPENVAIFSANFTAEEGATATYKVTLSPAEGEGSILLESADGKVAAEDLKNAVISFYGKAPTPRVLKAVVDAYVDIHGQTVKVTAPAVNVNVTLDAPQISKEYFLIGAPSSWDVPNTTLKFNHSTKNVYDDPIFTIVFPVTDGDCWFAVTDSISIKHFEENEGSWAQVFGCAEGNGNNGMEGALKRRADLTDDGSFKITVDGDAKFIKMTLNMMDYTYKFEKLNFQEYIYVPGDPKWNPAVAPAVWSPNFDGVYEGFAYLTTNGFKFVGSRNGWDPQWNYTSFTTYSDGITGSDNICAPANDFYHIKADLASSSLTLTPTTWGIIGPAQAGGWDADTDMTWNAEDESWTATLDLAADEFKFRANDKWDINVGGSLDNLEGNGGNIKITEAGTYEVKLFLTRSTSNKIYCTLTKK
jgi:hypothetical protein